MAWLVWMMAGAILTFVLLAIGGWRQEQDRRKQHQLDRSLRHRADAAEREMQAVMHAAIGQMFAATRPPRQ